jgi:hypothetical protein
MAVLLFVSAGCSTNSVESTQPISTTAIQAADRLPCKQTKGASHLTFLRNEPETGTWAVLKNTVDQVSKKRASTSSCITVVEAGDYFAEVYIDAPEARDGLTFVGKRPLELHEVLREMPDELEELGPDEYLGRFEDGPAYALGKTNLLPLRPAKSATAKEDSGSKWKVDIELTPEADAILKQSRVNKTALVFFLSTGTYEILDIQRGELVVGENGLEAVGLEMLTISGNFSELEAKNLARTLPGEPFPYDLRQTSEVGLYGAAVAAGPASPMVRTATQF